MFDQLFTSQRTIDHHSNSPLLEERLRYLAHCALDGKHPKFAPSHCSTLARFYEQFDLEAKHDVDLGNSKRPPMFGLAVALRPTA